MSQNKRSTPTSSKSQAASKFAYERTNQSSKKSSPLLPILGLIFFIILAVGGWLASDAIVNAFMQLIPGLNSNDLPAMTRKIVATVAVVIVGMILFGLFAAILTPKDAQSVSEKDLAKEKELMQERARAARAKQRSRGR
jgi:Na+/proline symporter